MICNFLALHNSNYPSARKMNKMQTLRRSGQTKMGSQLNSINLKNSRNNMANPVIPLNNVCFLYQYSIQYMLQNNWDEIIADEEEDSFMKDGEDDISEED